MSAERLDAVAATERLASMYSSAEAQRGVWRGAAMVRRQVAVEAKGELERLYQERIAALYEAREAVA